MKPLKLEELRESSVLLAGAPPRLVRGTLYGFLLCAAVLLVWSYYVHVPIIVTAEGRVRPAGRIWRVDAETSGRVVSVEAQEHQKVEKGDLLMRLDSAPLVLELKGVEREVEYLGPERAELGRMSEFLAAFKAGRSTPPSGLDRHRERFAAWVRELELAEVSIRKNRQEVTRLEKLDRAVLVEADLARARLSLAEAEASYRLSLARHRAEVERDLRATEQKLETLRIDLEQKKDRLKRMDIVAPVRGTVTHVAIRHSGEVVAGGDRLFHISPEDSGFMAEVWVPGHQAGFVNPEMAARVVVLTFPEAQFGYLPGVVTSVSPDVSQTPSDSDSEPLYRVEVKLENDRLEARDGRVGLLRLGLLTRARLVVREERLLFHVVDAVRQAFRTGS